MHSLRCLPVSLRRHIELNALLMVAFAPCSDVCYYMRGAAAPTDLGGITMGPWSLACGACRTSGVFQVCCFQNSKHTPT